MLLYDNAEQLIGVNLINIIIPEKINNFSKRQFIRKNKSIIRVYEVTFAWGKTKQMRIVFVPTTKDLEAEVENNLLYLIENSPIATMIINHESIIEHANVAFHEIIKTNHLEQKQPWSFFDLVHQDSRTNLSKLIQEVSSGLAYAQIGSYHTSELKLLAAHDQEINVLVYINRLSQLDSMPIKLLCNFIDTSDRKTLEMNFVHSQKMQAVGQLAGGIAHDFNNLLTAMMGFCDLLLMRHPPGDQSFADIMQIKQNTNRAAGLVRQLLAFSRKQVLQPEVLDITIVFDEISNLIRRLIGENIELNINHARDLWLVKVDKGQIEQVIMNLAVNSRDAMEKSGVLTIQTSNVMVISPNSLDPELISPVIDEKIEPGEYVLIEIIDTGTGIPKHLIGKIFEPFFTTKEVGAGTGLGLSTVYGIVKQTGGYIYLSTETNKGTKFCIFLKSYRNEEIEFSSQDLAEKDSSNSHDLTGDGTILMVEDEVPVRMFAVHALTNKGYKVFEAEDAEKAIQIVELHHGKIDVIITDVIMPGMTGPAMIAEVHAKYPNIKVIFISGYAEDAFVKQYGADHKFNFLAKPFNLKELAGKVKEVINKS